jgi:hypothetical protein
MKKLLLLALLATPAFSNPIKALLAKIVSKPVAMKVTTAALLAQQVKVYGKAIKDDKRGK